MGTLDAAVHVGKETVYGTPVAPTRSFEAMADIGKRTTQFLESAGMRGGMEALRSNRRRSIGIGGEGPMELDVLTKGMGLLFEQMLGFTATVAAAVNGAQLQTHKSTSSGPDGKSATVQMIRPKTDGTTQQFTYHGGKVKTWELAQAIDELLKLKLDWDYEDEDKTFAAGTPAYPASAIPFAWHECAVTVDGAAVGLRELSVKGDNKLKTDRRLLRGSSLKKEPLRVGMPEYDGSLAAEFESTTLYDLFVAGTIVPIVATWTGPNIGAGQDHKVILTLAACQFSGDSPVASTDDLSTQPLPFKVLHNGTDPAVKLEYNSTDAAV